MLVNLAVHKFCCKTGWSKDYPDASDKAVIWRDDHPKECIRRMTSEKVSSHEATSTLDLIHEVRPSAGQSDRIRSWLLKSLQGRASKQGHCRCKHQTW